MRPYNFYRGETIRLFLEAVGASAEEMAIVTGASATLKLALGDAVPPAETPASATFSVSASVPSGDDPGGWYFTLSKAVSEDLEPGLYVTTARLELAGGDADLVDPIFLRIREST